MYDNRNLDIDKELLKFHYGVGMWDKVEYIHDFEPADDIIYKGTYGLFYNSCGAGDDGLANFDDMIGLSDFNFTSPVHWNDNNYFITTLGPTGVEGEPNPMKAELSVTDDNIFRVQGDLRANEDQLQTMNILYAGTFKATMKIDFNVAVQGIGSGAGINHSISKTFKIKRIGINKFEYTEMINYVWGDTTEIIGYETATPIVWHPIEALEGKLVYEEVDIPNEQKYYIGLNLHINKNNDDFYLTTCAEQIDKTGSKNTRIYINNTISIINEEEE